jgi:hypothetical protein
VPTAAVKASLLAQLVEIFSLNSMACIFYEPKWRAGIAFAPFRFRVINGMVHAPIIRSLERIPRPIQVTARS